MSKMPRTLGSAKSALPRVVIGCLSPLLLIAARQMIRRRRPDWPGRIRPRPQPPTSPAPSSPRTIDPTTPLPFQILRRSPKGLPVIPLQVARTAFRSRTRRRRHQPPTRPRRPNRLLPGTGMLFVHPDDQIRGYWMYDCLIDIDVAFLDQKGRIVAMHRMKREAPRRAPSIRTCISAASSDTRAGVPRDTRWSSTRRPDPTEAPRSASRSNCRSPNSTSSPAEAAARPPKASNPGLINPGLA